MPDLIKTEALVIYTTRWQESSKIVHLFSEEHGYIKAIAKGAFRPKSHFRGVLETLNFIEIIISQKSTRSLQIISQAAMLNSFLKIREDLQKTSIAFAILEIIKKLLSTHEPVSDFFRYTTDLLSALNDTGSKYTRAYLWHFLLVLSQTLGFGWEFDKCLRCKKTPAVFPVELEYQNGGVLCGNCHQPQPRRISSLTEKQLTMLTKFSQLAPVDLEEFNAAVFPDFIDILLQHLTYHTELALDLKSLKWYV